MKPRKTPEVFGFSSPALKEPTPSSLGQGLVSSTAIKEFVDGAADLASSVRERLRLLGLKTDSRHVIREFHEASQLVTVQQATIGPVLRRSIDDAHARLRSAFERAEELAIAFANLKDDAQDADVIWACLFSGAQLRMTLLLLSHRFQLDVGADMIEQLRLTEDQMLQAMAYAAEREDHTGAAFAAVELATKAYALGEDEKESRYCNAARQHAEGSCDLQLVQEIEGQLESRKEWMQPEPGARLQQIIPEQDISAYAELVIRANGWPEDRRKHVEDDIRKLNYAAIAVRDFCRHLQPIQDLIDGRSPATIFAGPTKYTCLCAFFGHKTRIECDDMEVVIKAMQRSHCDECTHRAPAGDHND
jgi:hypothetical protein